METWDEWTAIVGPWPDVASAERTVRDVLEHNDREVRTEHAYGMNIVRIYALGAGAWVSGETALTAKLASEGKRLFGAVPSFGEDGETFDGHMDLFELEAKLGTVYVKKELGQAPADDGQVGGVL